MAAVFPNAKRTFTSVVNGVTKLVAALFNSPYEEIEAVQTFIGPTGGGAQAYSESLTNLLINYRRGCAVEYKGAADLYVRSGEIMITDSSGNRRLRRNTSDTTVTWSDIDTGSEANAIYYVYAVADASATTFTVKISTSSSAPSGATFYRKLGSFTNNTDIIRSSITNVLPGFPTGEAPGTIKEWGGAIATIPGGYLFCDGSAVSRTTYADLFAAIGTIHGNGDGSTTFNLPDRRDFTPMGASQDDSGVPKSNVTGSLLQSSATGVMPAHTHNVDTDRGGTPGGQPWVIRDDSSASLAGTQATQSTGTGTKVIPVFKAAVFMIKF